MTYSVIIRTHNNIVDESLSKDGFKTRQEARNYELSVTSFSTSGQNSLLCAEAYFDDLLKAYAEEKKVRVRQSTFVSYCVAFDRFIKPGFSGKKLNEIEASDVRAWQNGMMQLDYSQQYLRKVDSILASVFKYGVRFFGMKTNPSVLAGSIGSYNPQKINFWTLDEFNRFMKYIKDPKFHLIYDMLYWTGLRVGELLALTPEDIDFTAQTIRVNKTYRRYHRADIISPPKTEKSNRVVYIHKALNDELAQYLALHPQVAADERVFQVCFDSVRDRLERAARKAGVKRIKIHDLRHSHASLLINMNVTPLMVSERLGHEKVETTLNIYSHLYPGMQKKLVKALDDEFEKGCEDAGEIANMLEAKSEEE